MRGPLERGFRRFLRMRIICALILCVLTFWFTSMVGTFRRPGLAQTLGVVIGFVLIGAALLLLVHRGRKAVRPAWVESILEHADRLGLLLIVNLMVLTVLPALPLLAFTTLGQVAIRLGLPILGRVSAHALFGLFAAGILCVVCLLVLRGGERLAQRVSWLGHAFALADRAVVVAIIGYWLYGITLAYNGSLDRSPAVQHPSRVVAASGLFGVRWADVESWRHPGATERVLIFIDADRDDLWKESVAPGLPIVIHVRAGLLGMPWVERMRIDRERNLERLVATVPSAGIPRKQLVQALMRDARWDEAAAQAQAYMRYYPGDNTFALSVATSLRAGRQREADEIDPHARLARSRTGS